VTPTPELSFSVKEALVRLEAKVDALAAQVGGAQLAHASLEPRVEQLEKAGDRRWMLVPTWIGTGAALVLALVSYVGHH